MHDMKSLFIELWAVSSLRICPELSGGRKGGGEENLFVQEERNCQRDCTDKCCSTHYVVLGQNCHLSTTGKMVYGGSSV